MKIHVAKSAGFCFGVRRALKIAIETARSKPHVFMLGDIVHNEDVVRDVKKVGIKKVSSLEAGKNKALIIRAHGAPMKTLKTARSKGYKVIDATCPMVKEIHEIAKHAERQGNKIIVIGDKKHDEVLGIIGQLKTRAIVIDKIDNIPCKKIKKIKKAAIVLQSTQNIEKALKIADCLRKDIKKLKFFNTICNPTKTKQGEIRKMPLENNIMLIIGSKTSANTKRLYQISKSLNKNSYWINSAKDLKKKWFRKVKAVGITAGASTPDYTTQAIIKQIKSFKN